MDVFILFVVWTLLGFAASHFAEKRGRNPIAWFFIGLLMGLLGLLLLFLMPDLSAEKARSKQVEPPRQSDPFEGTKWYYLNAERQQVGPIGFVDLKRLRKEGQVHDKTFVWSEMMIDWQKIEELEQLRLALNG